MRDHIFPEDFLWGSATASYQVEGASREGGRGECIWDEFSRMPGKVIGNADGSVAVDQYHRYKEDVRLMKDIDLQAYRFSVAWPRIFPEGRGKRNPDGFAYYKALCDELHSAGIKTCCTMYHWDLPQALEDKGGWAERSTVDAFLEYADACFEELGDYVDQWITFNEPYCIAYLGYYQGVHAPGKQDLKLALRAVHHINLAHGRTVKLYRSKGLKAPIGITCNLVVSRPARNDEESKRASLYCTESQSGVFTEPIFEGTYPKCVTEDLGFVFPIEEGDMEDIHQKIDFFGINYYSQDTVVYDGNSPFGYKSVPMWQSTTDMGWPIIPEGFRDLLRWIDEKSGHLPLYITENGYANADTVSPDGRVHDMPRINYLKDHFEVVEECIKEGIDIRGYFVWSFIDNYEWAYGYTKRFGITYCDYTTLERIPKDSYYFLRDVIAGHRYW